MHRLLHIKHWQFFLLIFVLPFITQIVLMGGMLYKLKDGGPAPAFGAFLIAYISICVVLGSVLLMWLWTVGTFLYHKLPENLHMNIRRFKRNLIIPCIYFVFILLFIVYQVQAFDQGTHFPAIIFVIIPIHLFCIYCMFYTLYFIAKTLTMIEINANATFGDYAGNFFLLWFWPIGIWFIQPKINALAAGDNTTTIQ